MMMLSCSVAGDLSFWEFSGYEPYYVTYDRFLGDPNAIYVVVASMKDDAAERTKQLDFWMNFIRTRMIPVEPIGEFICGFFMWSAELGPGYCQWTWVSVEFTTSADVVVKST